MYYILHPNSPSPRKHKKEAPTQQEQIEQLIENQSNLGIPELEKKVEELSISKVTNIETIKNYHEKFLNVKAKKHQAEQELKALKQKVSKLQKDQGQENVQNQYYMKEKQVKKNNNTKIEKKVPLSQNTQLMNLKKAEKIRKQSQKANTLDKKQEKNYEIKQQEKRIQNQKKLKEMQREQRCLQDYQKKIYAEEQSQLQLQNEIKKLKDMEKKLEEKSH